MEEYLRLIAAGKPRLDKILEQEYALEEAEQAYADLQGAAEKPLGHDPPLPNARRSEAERREVRNQGDTLLQNSERQDPYRCGWAGNFAKAVHLPNLQNSQISILSERSSAAQGQRQGNRRAIWGRLRQHKHSGCAG